MQTADRERRHPVHGGDEGHRLIAGSAAGGDELIVQTRRAVDGTISYLAMWWPAAGDPVVLAERGVADNGRSWEIRHSGLWAEQVCEVPFEHWSYGLEAFALELDDPVALLGAGLGHRVAFGFELDFVAGDELVSAESSDIQIGELSGIVLLGVEQIEIEHWPAHRVHWWDGAAPMADRGPVGAIAIPDDETIWVGRDELGLVVGRSPDIDRPDRLTEER